MKFFEKKFRNKGFTLIELAIVIMVLSFLVAGVLAGKQLIIRAQASSIIYEVNQIKSRWDEFLGIHGFVPGDNNPGECEKVPEFYDFNVYGLNVTGVLCSAAHGSLSSNKSTTYCDTTYYACGASNTIGIVSGLDSTTIGAGSPRGSKIIDGMRKQITAHMMFSLFANDPLSAYSNYDKGDTLTLTDAYGGSVATTGHKYSKKSSGPFTDKTLLGAGFYPKFTVGSYYWRFVGLGQEYNNSSADGYVNFIGTAAIGKGDLSSATGYNYVRVDGIDSNKMAIPAFTLALSRLLKIKLDSENSKYPLTGDVFFAPYADTNDAGTIGNLGLKVGSYPGVSSTDGSGDYCVRHDATHTSWVTSSIPWAMNHKSKANQQVCSMFIKLKQL